MNIISFQDFSQVELRTGTIIKAEFFEKAKKPAYKIWADFGPKIGILQTSAQITKHYKPDSIIGKQIVGCINIGEKNVAGFISQFLLLGLSDGNDDISLIRPDHQIPNGNKVH